MDRFDDIAPGYAEAIGQSIAFCGQDHAFFTEVKAQLLCDLVDRRLGDPRGLMALDVGCGPGLTDRLVAPRFLSLTGVDTAPAMVEAARSHAPQADYQSYDGRALPFPPGAFHVCFAINVLHHVPRADRPALVAEMARVTRRTGIVALFEHNPRNPLTRRAVDRCPLDEGVELLDRGELAALVAGAGLRALERRYILFFPWRGRAFRALERLLARVPLGAQHYAAGRRL